MQQQQQKPNGVVANPNPLKITAPPSPCPRLTHQTHLTAVNPRAEVPPPPPAPPAMYNRECHGTTTPSPQRVLVILPLIRFFFFFLVLALIHCFRAQPPYLLLLIFIVHRSSIFFCFFFCFCFCFLTILSLRSFCHISLIKAFKEEELYIAAISGKCFKGRMGRMEGILI